MIYRLSPPTRFGLTLIAASGLALGVAGSASSCNQNNNTPGFGGGGSGGSSSGTSGTEVNHGKELFAQIDQDLGAVCSQCHDVGGISDAPFLAGPDHYRSITSWPGIIVKNPTQSKLETVPITGPQHPYVKLDSDTLKDTLFVKVKAWLAEEAKALNTANQADAAKGVDPFAPILGFNAVYLEPFGAEFTGMAVTFIATQVNDHTLKLDGVAVHPTADLGIHLVHPLFVINSAKGELDPDPVDSFSNLDQTFQASATAQLGPGVVFLTNWAADAKLSIGFQKIESVKPMMMGDGGMPTGACKDVTAFNTNVAQLLKTNCINCHGGANGGAKAAVDMSALNADAAATCAQVKNRVNPASPAGSQLFITTDPGGNAAHPFKFGGDAAKFGAFKTSVSMWISAEK